MDIKFYDTLSRKKQVFKPIKKGKVGLYTCGPTVYNYAHIGNLRTYIFEDILQKTLEYNGYKVKRVMNITDVGHLTSDADLGEDKIEKEAAEEKKSVWEIAKFYAQSFFNDIKALNIKKPDIIASATETINDQIKIVKKLTAKKYAYETSKAVYFDVSKFKNYNKLSRQPLFEKLTAARENIVEDPEKRNSADFSLWFKLIGRFENHIMRWPSPWGLGFPGWHIECSAISTKHLGQPFDIHAGGIDHIGTHHTNEIAQSEAAFNKPLANFWLHGEFLLIDQGKMAKSEGNFITLNELKKKFDPLAYRYLILTSHYRSQLNFTWKAMAAAENALANLRRSILDLKNEAKKNKGQDGRGLELAKKLEIKFVKELNNDLNTPKTLAILWEIIRRENIGAKTKLSLIENFDKILGLNLKQIKSSPVPQEINELIKQRSLLRKDQKWNEADKIRKEIENKGWMVKDKKTKTEIIKIVA